MSRTTEINVQVNSGKSVVTLQKLKSSFEELKVAKDAVAKDGKIKLEVDLTGIDKDTLDLMAKSISKMNTAMSKLSSTSQNFSKLGNNFSVTNNTVTKATKTTDEFGKSLGGTNEKIYGSIIALNLLREAYTSLFSTQTQLKGATFNVGIASQMNISQIDNLNASFSKLATNVPATAKEMADAVDGLIRSGRGFEDSKKIIEQVAILSAASGDNLKDTAQVVTKVMVSLGISGDRVKDTLTTMHSTAIQTASDMGYLAESFKDVAGTASVLVKQSGLSGAALDDYKQKVLDVSMASIGSLANLGLSASQAGTKVKNLFLKMVATEQSARALFDTSMKLQNISLESITGAGVKGQLFDYDALSNMAKTDLPKALSVMSEMYIKGQLTTQTMQKMFTARHFMDISSILIDMGGNAETFVEKIAKGVNYSDDFYKSMFDINNQYKLFKNNITESNSMLGQFSVQSTTGILQYINELPKANDTVKGLGSTIAGMTGIIGTASLAIGGFLTYIKPLLIMNPYVAGLSAITMGIAYFGKEVYDTNKHIADLNINMGNNAKAVVEANKSIEDTINLNKILADVVKSQEGINAMGDYSSMIEEASTMMGLLIGKNKEFSALLSSMEGYKQITGSMLPTIDENQKKEYELAVSKISTTTKESELLLKESVNGYVNVLLEGRERLSKDANSLLNKGIEPTTVNNTIAMIDKQVEKASLLRDKFLQLSGSDLGITERNEAMSNYATEIGVTNNELAKFYEYSKSDIFDKNTQSLKDNIEIVKKYEEQVKTSYQEVNKQMTDNAKAINMITSATNQIKLNLFEKTGEYGGKTGGAGIISFFNEENMQKGNDYLNYLGKELDALEKKRDGLQGIKDQGSLTDESQKELENTEKLIQEKKLQVQMQKDIVDGTEKVNEERFKGYETSTKTMFVMLQILKIEGLIKDEKLKGEKADKTVLSSYESYLEVLNKELTYENKVIVAKKTKTEYQIKYNNYLKENLSLELEMEKILRSQGYQQKLIYEYKQKELDANIKIGKTEVDMARKSLKETEGGSKYLNIGTAKEGQSLIDDFWNKYSGKEITDKALKGQYESLKVLTEALAKVEKLQIEKNVNPLKDFDETVTKLPKNIEDVYKTLDELGSMKGNFKFKDELQRYLKSDLVKEIEKVNKNIDWNLNLSTDNLQEKLEEAKNNVLKAQEDVTLLMKAREERGDSQKPLTKQELELLETLRNEKNILDDIKDLNDKNLNIVKRELELRLDILDVCGKTGEVLSSLGSAIDMSGLEDLGGIISSFSEMSKTATAKKFSFGDMFTLPSEENSAEWANNFGNAMENALKGIDFGAMVGTQIGDIFGGGQNAKSGGALGGMFAQMGGASALSGMLGMGGSALATGGASLAITAGSSLIGGLFGDSGDKQAEADKRSAEQKKIYDKNTDALNELARNMANLNSGVDSLNTSLISSFAKMPTFGNLTDVTTSLEEMFKLMSSTRMFDSVAYEVTKTKKGKSGFMGIGSKQGYTETKTYEMEVQQLLDIYGYKGTINDMTTEEMRKFSEWLDEYDMGSSDNFSILADAIGEYAEALDKFDKNIDKFFYDATMEGFEGISSIQQEVLRQQIEDFYKNLGIVIDEEMSAEIDKMAESMSVMVTAMQEVRTQFVSSWRDSGDEAGEAFLKSMSPYMDAMLNNMSQVFFDVYFSDIVKGMDIEFKAMAEELVELKKQGAELKWDDVAASLSDNFQNVIDYIISAKQQTASFNDIILAMQKQALEAGMSLSDLLELGIVTGTQKTVIDSFTDALLSEEDAFVSIGNMLGETVGQAMAKKIIDEMMTEEILNFSSKIDEVMKGDMGFDALAGLANEALSMGVMVEAERRRLEAIMDMFAMGDINYESQDSEVQYSNGTSQSVINNYYLSSTVEAGNVIESDSVERLADELLDQIIEKLKVDKGIDITKNY